MWLIFKRSHRLEVSGKAIWHSRAIPIGLIVFNLIFFQISPADDPNRQVVPVIDAVSLSDRVTAFETARGYTDPAGGYGGIVPAFMNYGPLDDYFLGRGVSPCRQDDGTQYLLGCECGEVGCWPLMGRIVVTEASYRWECFGNPFREARDYSDFGPFVFERAAYEAAVARLVTEIGAA
jgi:hypothetical protein